LPLALEDANIPVLVSGDAHQWSVTLVQTIDNSDKFLWASEKMTIRKKVDSLHENWTDFRGQTTKLWQKW
jgi:hypothetical protein